MADDDDDRPWAKIADKIHDGDHREVLHELRDFERKHGTSPETARPRAWLESQPATAAASDLHARAHVT